ncbi:MAG: COG1361 family protein [Methanotrichaceae archaeon]
MFCRTGLSLLFLALLISSACAWSLPFSAPFISGSEEAIEIHLDLDEEPIHCGDPFTYAIHLTNCGSHTIQNVLIKDDFGQIGLLDLSSGESLTLTRTTPPITDTVPLRVTVSSGSKLICQESALIQVKSSGIKTSNYNMRPMLDERPVDLMTVTAEDETSTASPLTVMVTTTPGIPSQAATCEYNLTNAGDDTIWRVTLIDERGTVLGILSELGPGETLIIAGDEGCGSVKVTGIDSSGRTITGKVIVQPLYTRRGGSSSSSTRDVSSSTCKGSDTSSENLKSDESDASPKHRSKVTPIQFTSVDFAPQPNRPVKPEIETSADTGSKRRTDQPAISNKTVSSDLKLNVSVSPEKICRGQKVSIVADVENTGNNSLTEITVSDSLGEISQIHKSETILLHILQPGLNITAQPQEAVIYSGESMDVMWTIRNVGESDLEDVIFTGDDAERCRLPRISPGDSIPLSVTYSPVNECREIWSKVEGSVPGGEVISDSAKVLIKTVSPEISLDVKPSEVKACAGKNVNISCFITNSGDDPLTDVVLFEERLGVVGRMDRLEPGDCKAITRKISADSNSTLKFKVKGTDSKGKIWTDTDTAEVRMATTDIVLSIWADPPVVEVGEKVNVICTVENQGGVPIHSTFIIGKSLGPLGTIDYLAPGSCHSIQSEIEASEEIDDLITAEGFSKINRSSPMLSVRDQCELHIGLRKPLTAAENPPVEIEHPITTSISPANSDSESSSLTEDRNKTQIPDENWIETNEFQNRTDSQDEPTLKSYEIDLSDKTQIPDENWTETNEFQNRTDSQDEPTLKSYEVDQSDKNKSSGVTGLINRLRDMIENINLRKSKSDERNLSENLTTDVSSNKSVLVSPETSGRSSITKDSPKNIMSIPPAEGLNTGPNQSAEVSPGTTETSSAERPITSYPPSFKVLPNGSKSEPSAGHLSESFSNFSSPIERTKSTIEETRLLEFDRLPQIIEVKTYPSEPTDGSPVVISVHASDDNGIESVNLHWGIASVNIGRPDLLDVGQMNTLQMKQEEGTSREGYWSCEIPGQPAGTYMDISVEVSDGTRWSEAGPYLLFWTAESSKRSYLYEHDEIPTFTEGDKEGMCYVESTKVSGQGKISLKNEFRESSARYKENLAGHGTINMQSQEVIRKGTPEVNFSNSRSLDFDQGQLKGTKKMESPTFHSGMGASVTERFNTNTLEKHETGMIRNVNRSDNTLTFDTQQAFEGMWSTKTEYSKFSKKIKTGQVLDGSFKTQKKIMFKD